MALTEAQKRANQKNEQGRKDRGEVKRTYWMSPETLALMGELRARHKSNDKVIEAAVAAYGRPRAALAPEPVKAVHEAEKPVAKPSKAKSRLKGEWKAP